MIVDKNVQKLILYIRKNTYNKLIYNQIHYKLEKYSQAKGHGFESRLPLFLGIRGLRNVSL